MKRVRDDTNAEPQKRPASGAARAPSGPSGQQRLTTSDALSYLQKVKGKYADNKKVYDTFLEIMKEFKAQRIDTDGVIRRVKSLFKGERDLILGFNFFLPKGYEITCPEEEEDPPRQRAEFNQAINYVNKVKQRFASDERVYKAFLEVLDMYRKGQKTIGQVYDEVARLFSYDEDLLKEFAFFLPDNGPASGQAAREVGRAPPAVAKGKETLEAGKREAKDEAEGAGRSKLAAELRFFENIKSKVRNRDAYQDFLKCLNLYAQEIIQRSELMSCVQDILGRYPQLQDAFQEFLAMCEMLDPDVDARSLQEEIRQHQHLGSDSRRRGAHLSAKDKYLLTPISELDLRDCERIQTSYVRIPADYPVMRCRGRASLPGHLAGVFNDTWVSITSGTEDYSFKHMRKNQYEENLFWCEDDCFEMEMDMQRNRSTIAALEPLAAQLHAMPAEERSSFKLATRSLRAFHFLNISRIYGDQGSQVVSILQRNPGAAVPVILKRCLQKRDEWSKVKAEMAAHWKKVSEQNYHRSLDHRSFYFKQDDKRGLGMKVLLAELKDAAEKRRSSDDALRLFSTAVSFRERLQPDLKLCYPDASVHDDLFHVLRLAARNSCPPQLERKMLSLLATFVEPIFNRPPRSLEQPVVSDADVAASPSSIGKAVVGGKDSEEEEDEDEEPVVGAGKKAGVLEPGTPCRDDGTHASNCGEGQSEPDLETAERSTGSTHAGACASGLALSRPLASECGALDTSKPEAGGGGGGGGREPPQCVAYVNELVYVFFRLHHVLYDRLRTARTCIDQKVKLQASASQPSTTAPSPPEGPAQDGTGAMAEEAAKMHSQFIDMASRLVLRKMDITAFEDGCRSLLGTNSYVLFTLDKLVQKVIKHMQAMVQEDLSLKAVALWCYEAARAQPAPEGVVLANAQLQLGEDNCIRIAWQPDAKQLSCQVMDPLRCETVVVPDASLAASLREFCEETKPLQQATGRGPALLLRRNLELCRSAPDDEDVPWLDNGLLCNGLECRFGAKAFKEGGVSYVLYTEDVYHRRRMPPVESEASERRQERRASKFHRWLESSPVAVPRAVGGARTHPHYLPMPLSASG